MGAQLGLMVRAASLRSCGGDQILAQGIAVEVHCQERIAWAKAPTIDHPPIREHFEAVGLTVL